MSSIIFSKTALLILISLLMLVIQNSKAQNTEKMNNPKVIQITPQEALQLLEKDSAIMIDVREIEELEILSYDVDKVINIPLGAINNFEKQVEDVSENRKIIMVCRSGRRSQKAAQILLQKGYSAVYNLKGGIIEWEKQQMKVKKGN
ncbi:rhodanese-like domain-containing protein [Bernardetia sp. ABR2-2B]|uniref:rhodanese-like domain-containing protein n=1 Tax=Bernardetia sp. ABR2-2B TaxID=3127472 RepID=UPI0030D2CC83